MTEQWDQQQWEGFSIFESTPSTLSNICMKNIRKNLSLIMDIDPGTGRWVLKKHIFLPIQVCDTFLEMHQKYKRVDDNFAYLFQDKKRTHICTLKLNASIITDKGLEMLLQHKPFKIELNNCNEITPLTVDNINNNSQNMVSLSLKSIFNIFIPDVIYYENMGYMFNGSNLQQVTVSCPGLDVQPAVLVSDWNILTHLDLSECNLLHPMAGYHKAQNLVSLILYNSNWTDDLLQWIYSMENLEHLDISQSEAERGVFNNPEHCLTQIIKCLPKLSSLDISGTNLGEPTMITLPEAIRKSLDLKSDQYYGINALVARLPTPFKFIGVYRIHHGATENFSVPADVVSGGGDEIRLNAAVKANMEKPALLVKVIDDLSLLICRNVNTNLIKACSTILEVLDKHTYNRDVLIACSTFIYKVMEVRDGKDLPTKLQLRLVSVIFNGMEKNCEDDELMSIVCQALCKFKIPDEYFEIYLLFADLRAKGLSEKAIRASKIISLLEEESVQPHPQNIRDLKRVISVEWEHIPH